MTTLARLVTPGRLIAAGVILLGVVFTLWAVPSNEYLFLPDKARPVAPLVTVAGPHKQDDKGGIYYVDVIIQKASLLDRLFPGLHNGATLYPASAVVGPGLTSKEQHEVDAGEMSTSQEVATAVAFRAVGKRLAESPAGVLVSRLVEGEPAVGALVPGDVIVAIDGRPVRTVADLKRLMATHRPGQTLRFRVERGDAKTTIAIRTVRARGSNRAVIGILPLQATAVELPRGVKFAKTDVVGPSAGLAFALDLLEKLGRDVDHGHRVAATGELNLNGSVVPIGGIKQKTIGAREAHVDAFLVPVENAPEARKYAKGLRIIAVKSFQQALHDLATLPAAG